MEIFLMCLAFSFFFLSVPYFRYGAERLCYSLKLRSVDVSVDNFRKEETFLRSGPELYVIKGCSLFLKSLNSYYYYLSLVPLT